MGRKFRTGDIVDAKKCNAYVQSMPIDRIEIRQVAIEGGGIFKTNIFYVGDYTFFGCQLTLIRPVNKLYKGIHDARKLIIEGTATKDQRLAFINFNLVLSRIMEK